MTPEEQLDRLLERWERGEALGPIADEELAARLAAAAALAQLGAIEVPAAFAARLEARLRARGRGLGQPSGRMLAVPRPEARARSRWGRLGRAWITACGMAAVLLLLCIGTFTVAAQSLPGDALYGIKQFEQQVALALASNPADRAQQEISQLRSALADLRAVVSNQRPAGVISQALGVVATKTRESQAAVGGLPAGQERVAAQRDLASALGMEEQTLRQLLAQVQWPLRLSFTQQLGALGEAIPTITSVQVSSPTEGHLLVRVTGSNFAPGAILLINGAPVGTVQQESATQVVVFINSAEWPSGARTVGVVNPDGTVAQVVVQGADDDNDNDDHNPQGTPGATSTAEPGENDDDGNGQAGAGISGSTATPHPSH